MPVPCSPRQKSIFLRHFVIRDFIDKVKEDLNQKHNLLSATLYTYLFHCFAFNTHFSNATMPLNSSDTTTAAESQLGRPAEQLSQPIKDLITVFALLSNLLACFLALIALNALYRTKKSRSATDLFCSANNLLTSFALSVLLVWMHAYNASNTLVDGSVFCTIQGILITSFITNQGLIQYTFAILHSYTIYFKKHPNRALVVAINIMSFPCMLCVGLMNAGVLFSSQLGLKMVVQPSGIYCAPDFTNRDNNRHQVNMNIVIVFVLLSSSPILAGLYALMFHIVNKVFEDLPPTALESQRYQLKKKVGQNILARGVNLTVGTAIVFYGVGIIFAVEVSSGKSVSPILDAILSTMVDVMGIIVSAMFLLCDQKIRDYNKKYLCRKMISGLFRTFFRKQSQISASSPASHPLNNSSISSSSSNARSSSDEGEVDRMHSRGTLLPVAHVIDVQFLHQMQQVHQPQPQKRPSILQLHIPLPQKLPPHSLVGSTDGGPKSRSANFEDEKSSQEYFSSNESVNIGSTRFDDAYIESPPVFTPVL